MQGKLIILGIDSYRTTRDLVEPPSLEALQAAVGGPIEVVPGFTTYYGEPCVAFCHEEGKLTDLVANYVAQALWQSALNAAVCDDLLVGPIAIVLGDQELLAAI